MTSILAEETFRKLDFQNLPRLSLGRLPPYVFTAWDERIVDHPNFWTNLWLTDCMLTEQAQVRHLYFACKCM